MNCVRRGADSKLKKLQAYLTTLQDICKDGVSRDESQVTRASFISSGFGANFLSSAFLLLVKSTTKPLIVIAHM